MLTSPPSQNFYPQNLPSPPSLLPSFPPSPQARPNSLCRTLDPEIASSHPSSDLHGRSHHLISLRPPKKRSRWGPVLAKGSRSSEPRRTWPTVLWPTYSGSGSPHFARAPHRANTKVQPIPTPYPTQPALATGHWRPLPTTFTLLNAFLHSTSPIWSAVSYRPLSPRHLHTTLFVVHRDASQFINPTFRYIFG